jgi:hypothetical protein
MNLDLGQIAAAAAGAPVHPGCRHLEARARDSATRRPPTGAAFFEAPRSRAGPAPRGGRHLVGAGNFGADMQVTLTNDGPVTFNLRVPPPTNPNFPGPPDSLVL